MTTVQEQAQELRRRLQKKSIPFHTVFTSKDGEYVLEQLKKEFDQPILAQDDEFSTVIKAAQRDVIRYIEDMIKFRDHNYE